MFVSVKKLAVKSLSGVVLAGALLVGSGPTVAQEVVYITDPNQNTIAALPGLVMNISLPTDNPLVHWTAQRIVDCTTGAGTPFVMFYNSLNNFLMTKSDGWLVTLPFDQQYHCSTPADQLPYAFGIEAASTGLANVRGSDGQLRQQNVITSVHLRHIASNSYLVASGVGPVTLGPVPTAMSLNTVGTTTPASYLQMFASEFEAMKQAQIQAAQQAAAQQAQQPSNQAANQPAPDTNQLDESWRERLPMGGVIGLSENGSQRGLQVVPTVTATESAAQFDAGRWIMQPHVKHDFQGVEVPNQKKVYTFQNMQSSALLALINGQLTVLNQQTILQDPAQMSYAEWELKPGTRGQTTWIGPDGLTQQGEGIANYHIRHAASGNYIFMQNGFINVAPSQAIAWTFDRQ